VSSYANRADQHRPDPEGLATEARRLLASGLKAADVAHALRMPLVAVESIQRSPGVHLDAIRAGAR